MYFLNIAMKQFMNHFVNITDFSSIKSPNHGIHLHILYNTIVEHKIKTEIEKKI